ncbi:MDR family MFS transporter [Actinoplanes sp. TFC3]|uniref:MDR family MFS transporter n=1 Tax=Actinoplanes sp. TFC3 TaxID=1710355 RepID=UPI00082DDE0C|nr:MDR family MFS transporter [Actinoplanes sp. TFC3]
MTSTSVNEAGSASGPEFVPDRRFRTIFLALMLAVFLAAIEQSTMATATRTIVDDLHGFDLQAWATTAFLVTSTLSTPLYGKLSDIYGRRRLFLFSIALFVAGSLLCGLATTMPQLAACRAVQGLGAGGIMALALIIVGDLVPPRQRARYQAFFMIVFATSSVAGPVVGGLFAGADSILGVTGWRWLFFLNLPLGGLALAVVARVLHLPRRVVPQRIDWAGAILLLVTLLPLLTVAEQGRMWGWSSPVAWLCYTLTAAGLAGFVIAERTMRDEALLPLRLFRDRTVAIGSFSCAVTGMAMFSGMLIVPLYMQIVRGMSPTAAGLRMLPFVAGIMAGSLTSGHLIARTGRYRLYPVAGTFAMAAGMLVLAMAGAATSLWWITVVSVLIGVGLGCNMQPMITAMQNAVADRDIGVTTSIAILCRSLGGTLGTAALIGVLLAVLPNRVADAYAHAGQQPPAQLTDGSFLTDTSFLNNLPGAAAQPFRDGFAGSVQVVFLVAFAVVLTGALLNLGLTEKAPAA